MSVFSRILRAGEGKKVRRLAELVPLIGRLEPEMESLSDAELARRTVDFRERLDNGAELDDLLVEAFAVVREAGARVLGQRHYDVQLMGGMALHFGWIAEMKTGEGKTLVSTLPVYLNALTGRGVHLVTVNEYLAKRDADWMGSLHQFLGLSVGRVGPDVTDHEQKKLAYAADITYGTNTEFGFDYLRDNMARSREAMAQRGHVYAIVDEVDSILIDEARTPLIMSGPSQESAKLYYQFAGIARSLTIDVDYEVDEEKRIVVPTEDGIAKVEGQLGVDNLYDMVSNDYVHQLTKALQAKELYKRDKDYLVADGEVKIIDEFRGRTAEGRRWSDGLHQAVEAKERVKIREENHTWATVTLQNYFRLYEKLSGMTGTAETEAAEFANTYGMAVVPIPTNLPMVRIEQPDLVYRTEEAKFKAVVEDIVERHATGQPILVGTASVAKSEHLSELLDRRGVPHQVLNAKQHFREAEIVTQAGRLGGVTVATNMAGRGVDILLGGNPDGLAHHEALARGLDLDTEEGQSELANLKNEFEKSCAEEGNRVRELGGLYVLGSERHESRRIDNQLRGRAGRQGDVGESRFFLSPEDEIMRLFATGLMQAVMARTMPDDVPIDSRMVSRAIEKAQNNVEGRNAESRKELLKYDEVLDRQRKVIYELRTQIIDGEDLQARTEELLEKAVESVVALTCSGFKEDWDLDLLINEVEGFYPTQFTVEDLEDGESTAQLTESLLAEALDYYRDRDDLFPAGAEDARKVEREVMLQVIDQRWRDHLAEMDNLREGINLRSMGQQDPLVAWQREGYDMFGRLMETIDDDYLRYVLHVQVITEALPEVDLSEAKYTAPEEGGSGLPIPGPLDSPAGALPAGSETQPQSRTTVTVQPAGPTDPEQQRPLVKDANQKLGRNDPCWCESGKKFKLCHGAQ